MSNRRREVAGLDDGNGGCCLGVYSCGKGFEFERRGKQARLKIGGDQGYVDWLPNGKVKVGWRAVDWAMYDPNGRLEHVVVDIAKLLEEVAQSTGEKVYWADCQLVKSALMTNQSLGLMVSLDDFEGVVATIFKFDNYPTGERRFSPWGSPLRARKAEKELAALGVSEYWKGMFPELTTGLATYVYGDYVSVGCQTEQGRFVGHCVNLEIKMADFDDTQYGVGRDMVQKLFRSAVRH